MDRQQPLQFIVSFFVAVVIVIDLIYIKARLLETLAEYLYTSSGVYAFLKVAQIYVRQRGFHRGVLPPS